MVFWTVSDSTCDECGAELAHGSFLILEESAPAGGKRALCPRRAGLEHLEFLPLGDAALTRRSVKYSSWSAVVVRFSRARKRYERQGVLVENDARLRAEQEGVNDADSRAAARDRAAKQRVRADEQYIDQFTREIRRLFPGCPAPEAKRIARNACQKYSGRVGRSAAAKALDESAVDLAIRAHVRHVYTRYDRLLARGWVRAQARMEVEGDVDAKLDDWSG